MRRLVLPLAATVTAVASATIVVVGASAFGDGRGCAPPPRGADVASAMQVRELFVETAVLRRRPACSFDLVTASFRQGATRAQWAAGAIPVVPIVAEAAAPVVANAQLQRLTSARRDLLVEVHALGASGSLFRMVLVLRDGRWLVDYFAPAQPLPTPSTAS